MCLRGLVCLGGPKSRGVQDSPRPDKARLGGLLRAFLTTLSGNQNICAEVHRPAIKGAGEATSCETGSEAFALDEHRSKADWREEADLGMLLPGLLVPDVSCFPSNNIDHGIMAQNSKSGVPPKIWTKVGPAH